MRRGELRKDMLMLSVRIVEIKVDTKFRTF
jgi:hypothetical protein